MDTTTTDAPRRRPLFPGAPLMPVALAVASGVLLDRFGPPIETRAWALLALAALGLAGWRRSGAGAALLLVAYGALGAGWHHARWSDLAGDDLSRTLAGPPRPALVRGVVRDVLGSRAGATPGDPATTRAVLDLTGIHDRGRWREASGRALLVVGGASADLVMGAAIEASGSLGPATGPLNPGEFDFRDHLRARGIRLRLWVEGPSGLRRDPHGEEWPLTRGLGWLRRRSEATLVDGLAPDVAPLAAALLLGRREGVAPDVNDAFARTGTTHLLAISGLHLQVLAAVLWSAFRAAGLGRRGAFVAVGLATVVYAVLVGLMPSVVRSAAMTVGLCAAGFVDRKLRPANALAWAALLTLALNPSDLFDVGCQLSFLGVGALLWGIRPVTRWLIFIYYTLTFQSQGPGSPLDALERRLAPLWKKRVRRWSLILWSGVIVSSVAWLVAWPLVAYRFHVVSPIGILLNVPLIPMTSLALLAAGIALALSLAWPPLGMPAAWLCSKLLQATEAVVRWGAARPWGNWFVPGPGLAWVLVFYGLLALATWAWRVRLGRRRWAFGMLIAWALIGLIAPAPRPEALEVEVLAVGHGLAVIVQSVDGRTFLYDCGRLRDPKVGRRVIAPALWARGVRRLDAVILSHADFDHYGGLPDLLDRFAIGEVRVGPGFAESGDKGALALLDAVRARGVPVRRLVAGDRWEAAGAEFTVRHPPDDWRRFVTDNARSVVLDVASDGRHFLLTGDLEGGGLDALVAQPAGTIETFLAPHHGGRASNPDRLYRWARPRRVVASQAEPDSDAADALAPLSRAGTIVWRTWEQGAVTVRWTADGPIAWGFVDGPGFLAAVGGPVEGRFLWPRIAVSVAGLAVGLAICLALAVAEFGAWTLVLPGRRLTRSGDDPETDPFPGVPIEARGADGVRLAGVWHPAIGPNDVGRTVVLLHGLAEPTSLKNRIDALSARGWNVASLDARGHGLSGGDRTSFGGREAADLRAWLDVVFGRVGASAPLAVWGRSMGAAIAVRAAAEDGRIGALVLEAPYADLDTTIAGWLRRSRFPLPGLLARLIARRAEALAGVSLTRPSPIALAPKIHAPTIIVHGGDDTLVPPGEVRRLADAFARPPRVVEVAEAGHSNVITLGGERLLRQVAAFLAESLALDV